MGEVFGSTPDSSIFFFVLNDNIAFEAYKDLPSKLVVDAVLIFWTLHRREEEYRFVLVSNVTNGIETILMKGI